MNNIVNHKCRIAAGKDGVFRVSVAMYGAEGKNDADSRIYYTQHFIKEILGTFAIYGGIMEHLSRKLTNYILIKGVIEEDDFEIYQYGFQRFLELAINIISSVIISVLLDMKLECIVFFLFFIPLRSYSGGFHMEHYISCLLLSCLSLAGILCIVKHFSTTPLFSCILYFISLAVIKIIGSVDHPDRSIDEEDNLFFNKRANITLLISFIIFIFFLLSDNTRYLFLEALVFSLASVSLLIGKVKYS